MKLVIFDCDGTLVDSQHAIVAAMNDAFASEGLAVPSREAVLSVIGLSLDYAVARLLSEAAEVVTIERLADAYKSSFAARRARREVDEPLYPGMRDLIHTLSERSDVILGIATGKSRRGLNAVLEREAMAGYFATLQTSDTHPSKPHPSMLLAALCETGAAPEDTIMVGDTTFDIDMALAAGTAALGVSWGYHPEAALRAAGAHGVSGTSAELIAELDRLLLTRGSDGKQSRG